MFSGISINAAECYEQNETEAEASVKDPINDEPLLAQASSSAEENQESGSISKPQNYHDSPTIKVNETRGIIIDDGINDPETQDIKDNLKAGDDDDGTRKTKVSWSTKKHYSIIACEWSVYIRFIYRCNIIMFYIHSSYRYMMVVVLKSRTSAANNQTSKKHYYLRALTF